MSTLYNTDDGMDFVGNFVAKTISAAFNFIQRFNFFLRFTFFLSKSQLEGIMFKKKFKNYATNKFFCSANVCSANITFINRESNLRPLMQMIMNYECELNLKTNQRLSSYKFQHDQN